VPIEGVSSFCGGLCFTSDSKHLLVLDSVARVVMQFSLVVADRKH
jgi:hypothetical protein